MSDIIISGPNIPEIVRPARGLSAFPNERAFFHARKTFILSDELAVACAGDVSNILRCIDDIECNLDSINHLPRSLDKVREIANAYQNVRLIGAHNNEFRANYFYNPQTSYAADLSVFGQCYASGTGADSLIRKLRRRDAELTDVKREWFETFSIAELEKAGVVSSPKPYTDVEREVIANYFFSYQVGLSELSRLNIQLIVSELNGLVRPDYGGFFESTFYSLPDKRWIREYPSIYMVFEFCRDGRSGSLTRVGPTICYEPGDHCGEILTVDDKGNVQSHLTADLRRHKQELSFCSAIKRGWKPRYAHIGFVTKDAGSYRLFGTKSTNDHEQSEIIIDWDEKDDNPISFRAGINSDWLRRAVMREQ